MKLRLVLGVSVNPAGVIRGLRSDTSAFIRATVDGVTDETKVDVRQRVSSLVVLSGQSQTDTVGQVLPLPIRVLAQDAGGAGVPVTSISFKRFDGTSTGLTPAIGVTDSAGIVSLEAWTLPTRIGADSVQVVHNLAVNAAAPVTVRATAVHDRPDTVRATVPLTGSGTVGTLDDTLPAVVVVDQYGNTVPGLAVTFGDVLGGGSVTDGTVVTDGAGVARLGAWTLGTLAGLNQVTASVAGLPAVTFDRIGIPGAPTTLVVDSGRTQTAVAGDSAPTPLVIRVQDGFGNGIDGAIVTFAALNSAVWPAPAITVGGFARPGKWYSGPLAGPRRLRVALGALADTVTVIVGPAAPVFIRPKSEVTGTGVVGSAEDTLPVVDVTDQYGNLVPGVIVTFGSLVGGGTVTGGAVVTNASGLAQLGSWTLGTEAGTNSVTATVNGFPSLTPAIFTRLAIADQPVAIEVVGGDAQEVPAGAVAPDAPAARVLDRFGNPVAGVLVRATPSATGTADTVKFTGLDGEVRFEPWIPGTRAGPAELIVSFAESVDTVHASVVAAAPHEFVAVTAPTTTAAVGDTVSFSTRVIDSFGNPIAGLLVLGNDSPNGHGIQVGPHGLTDADGVGTVSFAIDSVAGVTNSFLLELQADPLITITFERLAVAGPLGRLAILAGNDQLAEAGTTFATDPRVVVTDRFGNPLVGITVHFSAEGQGHLVDTVAITVSDGSAGPGAWQADTTTGPSRIVATAGDLSVSIDARVVAGPAMRLLALDPINGDLPVGSLVSGLRVQVTDRYGNGVPGVTLPAVVVEGGGSVEAPGQGTSDSTGLLALPAWTLGATPGQNRIEIPLDAVPTDMVAFTRQGVNTALSAIVPVVGDSQTVAAGDSTALPLSVRAEGSGGLPLAGVIVRFERVSGGVSATAEDTTGADGIASAGRWYADTLTGSIQLRASSVGIEHLFTANVIAAAPARIALSGEIGTVVAGQELPTLGASVLDRYGNLVSWYDGDIGFVVVDSVGTRWSDFVQTPGPGGGGPVFGLSVDRVGAGYRIELSATSVPGLFYSPAFNVTGGIIAVTATASKDTLWFIGDTARIGVTAVNPYIPVSNLPVTWAVGDSTILRVTPDSMIKALAPGSTKVIAMVDGVADTITIVVRQIVTSLHLTPSDIVLGTIGDTIRLAVAASDSGGQPVVAPSVTWSSADNAVATGGDGLVTAMGVGATWIRASSGTAQDSVRVQVMGDPISRLGALVFTKSASTDPVTEELYLVSRIGETPVRLTTNAFQEVDPSLSPDGSKVVFSSKESGTFELWRREADGTSRVALTSNGAVNRHPVWSPDGHNIAWSVGGALWIMRADGDSARQLRPTVAGEADWVDDSTLVYADGAGLWRLRIGSPGAPTLLNGSFVGTPTDVAASHATGLLAIATSSRSLYITDLAGAVVHGPVATGTVNELAWSSDDSRIVYTYFKNGYGVGLVARAPDGSIEDTLSRPAEATRFPGRVPGIGRPAVGTPGSVIISSPRDTLAVGATLAVTALAWDFAFRATTTGLVWTSSDTSVATVDANGVVTGAGSGIVEIWAEASGRPSNHVRLAVGLVGFVYWASPSGSIGDIYRWDGFAAPAVRVTALGNVVSRPVSYSPSGGSFLFTQQVGGDYNVASFDLATGDVTTMVAGGTNDYPAWSRRGSFIAWAKGSELWVMRADTTGKRRLAAGAPLSIDWLDDTTIVYATVGGVYRIKATGTPDIDVVRISGFGSTYHQAAVSPDGVWVVYRASDVNLWRVHPDGSANSQLTSTGAGGYGDGGPMFTPDGNAILAITNGAPPTPGLPRGVVIFRADGTRRYELIPPGGGMDRNGVSMRWPPSALASPGRSGSWSPGASPR